MPWLIRMKNTRRPHCGYLKSLHRREWTTAARATAYWDHDEASSDASEVGGVVVDYAEATLPRFVSDAYKAQVPEAQRVDGAVVSLEWWAYSLPDFNNLPGMRVRCAVFEESGRGFVVRMTVELDGAGGMVAP